MRKTSESRFNFLTWVSFPSSLQLKNLEVNREFTHRVFHKLTVKPDSTIRVEFKVKVQDVVGPVYQWASGSSLRITGWYPNGEEHMFPEFPDLFVGIGTSDWHSFTRSAVIPPSVGMISCYVSCGYAASRDKPALTWFDDLKLYQNDVLIYSNDFSNWAPVIIPAEIITGVAMIKFIK